VINPPRRINIQCSTRNGKTGKDLIKIKDQRKKIMGEGLKEFKSKKSKVKKAE